jgi:oligoribonuclease NrnB/cAMP/cGMP phosphodiesterase (DHH superfamily)
MKCFYHNDLDGRCAGSIVSQYTGNSNKEDFFEVDYVMNLPVDKIEDGEQVWFVDYSFTEKTHDILTSLIMRNCDVIWIDHHTSSINIEKEYTGLQYIRGIRKDGISGAALTYMWCYTEKFDDIPYYIKLVSDYDCWQFKYEPNTTYFKLGIESEPFDALDGVWEYLNNKKLLHLNKREELIEKGKTIKTFIDQENTYYRDHFSYESQIAGHKCLVVNKKTNSWVFGDKYSEYPLVMVWVFDGNRYTYSIFSSNKDIDCSKIAESYGGGGHKGAAGFSSTEMLFKKC